MDAAFSEEGGYGSGPPKLPEIRIRKSSDAPSLAEVKQQFPAPLASFEALSDVEDASDTERAATDDEDAVVLHGYDAALTGNGVEGSLSLEGLGYRLQSSPVDDAPGSSEGHPGPGNEDRGEGEDGDSISTLENTPVEEQAPMSFPSAPATVAMDNSELTAIEGNAENGNALDLLGRDLTQSPLPPRPPPPTPQFDRSGSAEGEQGDEDNQNGHTAESFMASLESDYTSLDRGGVEPCDFEPYSDVTEQEPQQQQQQYQQYENVEYLETNYETPVPVAEEPPEATAADEGTYEKITIKLPGKSKSPKKPPPPRPKSPASWVDFEQGENTSNKDGSKSKPLPARPPPPSRPPAPKAAPPRPAPPKKNWESFDSKQKGKGAKGDGDGSEPASFDGDDDESALTDSKKSKSRGITPKKLKGFVTGKKDKKDKKDKAQKEPGEFKKFTADNKTPDKDSEQWQAFQAMLDRSKSAEIVTQQKITKLESKFDKELGETLAVKDPWTMAAPPDSTSTPSTNPFTGDPVKTAGWVGFDDDFGASTHDPVSKLTTLAVSPAPSPRHDPVPPNNSRRESIEANEVVDLLGISSDATSQQTEITDLLGLGDESTDGQTTDNFNYMKNPDIMALSRNIDDGSVKSSECSSPAPGNDPFDLSEKDEALTGAAISFVDDFLGISGQELKKPIDPLEALLNKDKKPPTPEPEEPPQDAVGGFLGMSSKIEGDVDSDPFGFGATSVDSRQSHPVNMDLFIVEEGDKIPEVQMPSTTDPHVFPKEDEVFVVPSAVTTATEDIFEVRLPDTDSFTIPKVGIPSAPSNEEIFKTTPETESSLIPDAEPANKTVITPSNDDFEFDPRAENIVVSSEIKPAQDNTNEARARPRPRARSSAASAATAANPFKIELVTHDAKPMTFGIDESGASAGFPEVSSNPFASAVSSSAKNPFTEPAPAASGASLIAFADDDEDQTAGDTSGDNITAAQAVSGSFNPFATITDAEHPPSSDGPQLTATDSFDPFETIHEDDAFEVQFSPPGRSEEAKSSDEAVSPGRINPFDKEPPLDDKFASFEPQTKTQADEQASPKGTPSQVSTEEEEEDLEPLEPFYPEFTGEGWKVLMRQPVKKKLTQNRFWKEVYVKIIEMNKVFYLKIYANEECKEQIHELPLQPSFNLCNMGLQTFDQFGKCHTIKIQYVFYRERVGMKAERIAPTLSDLTRVRDFKGLKDLVHKPKATMILDHAPQASELLKFGGLTLAEFKSFIREIENVFFKMEVKHDKSHTYTKDEITIDVIDEYYAAIDKDGHILTHKARVRVFCLAFLSGNPFVEVGINDKRRRGKEVVGRHDIIPIKTEEWIKIEDPEFHYGIDDEEYAKTKVVKLQPLDACKFELMRFRIHPKMNKELPLQIRAQMSVIDHHVEIRADVMIPGYYSNSRRATQTPCEDIMIRFPVPEPWIYLFRVEKRFRYGSVKSHHRKPGKIKGLERLTMMAQGMMPPSLIEVSSGSAKYEHIFHSIIWRINRLPERNEGAYKTHLFVLKVDLGPHDVMPEEYDKYCYIEYNMPNSTMSRAQVRSISVNPVDEHPDKWVHHLARYEYKVEVEFSDKPPKPPVPAGTLPENTIAPIEVGTVSEESPAAQKEKPDSDSSDSSDSD